MWWRESCAVIAAIYFLIHLIWLHINLVCLQANHCEVISRFTEVFVPACDYLGVFLLEAHTRGDFYKSIYVGVCLYQLLQNGKLFFGIFLKSPQLLESWLVYDGLMVALALLQFLRTFYAKEAEMSDLSITDSSWFWNGFFPKFLSFFLVNSFTIFAVNEMWHYFVEERTMGHHRPSDVRRFQCFSNQSWLTFIGCVNRLLHVIVFFFTLMMVSVHWSYMRTLGVEEFRLWAMLILSTLAVVNAFPWRGCVPNDPDVLQLWMKREVIICSLMYLLHVSESFEDTDFNFIVLKFMSNEFIMVYAVFAAKEQLILPQF